MSIYLSVGLFLYPDTTHKFVLIYLKLGQVKKRYFWKTRMSPRRSGKLVLGVFLKLVAFFVGTDDPKC